MALNNNQISNKGFWLTTDEEGHCFDQPLCETIKNLTKNKSLLDLGCGTGAYTKELQSSCTSAKGYDGNPNTPEISKGLCGVADLTQKQEFDKVDWVLSLEVGEHVPKESEDILLDNICSHSNKGVILSWAVPGQPGDGHINCQSNEYIINKMLDKGFNIDWDSTYRLRENATLWWFKNTLMCFQKLPIPKSITSMEKITFCIPSKSNLQYLKTCIPSIRNNAYKKDHDIIVFVDSDEDGTVKWLDQVKDEYNLTYYINPKLGEELYGIGMAYDFCIENSNTDIFMIFHADMILAKNADYEAYKYLKEKTVVCATRIEPPLHPNNGEKILQDFGMYPKEFKEKDFNQYIIDRVEQFDRVPTTEGIFAPWMMYKKEYLEILGGHDPILHSCREDSDIFNRMSLADFTFIQTWEGFVYHFTGRGAGSFDGDKKRHEFWQDQMNNSTKDFIRKWGQNVNHTPMMKPIILPKYDIGFIVKNSRDVQLIKALESWCSTIYVDEGNTPTIIKNYIDLEQPNTSFDLQEKVKPYDNEKNNEILVTIDGSKFTQQDFQIIQQLSAIIQESGEVGEFELGNLSIEIIKMNEYQNDLINL
tara:strand:- start:32 stop:1801 length:1770 start_codon:yes stop_codon:yes gene_type:complete